VLYPDELRAPVGGGKAGVRRRRPGTRKAAQAAEPGHRSGYNGGTRCTPDCAWFVARPGIVAR
jgi:hypothetical protein